jgi:CubicO group peptidase (beta-lactamase class C family)
MTVTPESVGLSTSGLERVDGFLQGLIDAGELAGAVTLVARHGTVVHRAVMGVDDTKSGKPLGLDTIFRIFSMTKPVTGVAMGILYDRGLWRPDDPIAKHLPELADRAVLAGFDDRGTPLLVAADHQQTMGELMTHTAGFGYGTDRTDPADALWARAKLLDSRSLDDFVARLAGLPLQFQPGSRWKYSLSMDVQGAIIERLSGQTLGDFMQQHIFGPLGMVDTAFFTPRAKLKRRAKIYYTGGKYRLRAIRNPLYKDVEKPPRLPLGGAGLVSTIGDYARFAQLLLNRGDWEGARIVSEEAVTLQTSNHLDESLLDPPFTAGHMRFRPGYGYGWNGAVFYDPELADLPVGRGTYQWDGAAGTWFWVDPENDLLFVGMVQLLSYSAPDIQEPTQRLLADAILDRKDAP